MDNRDILLDVRHLRHVFPLGHREFVRAVDDVSFQIRRGEVFGLVGESGSGKSTVARCIMNLYRPTGGEIYYQGINICDPAARRASRRMLQTTRQMIFQDSGSSLDQRMRVCDLIAEPLRIHRITPPRGTCRAEAAFQMHYVGLDERYLDAYPPELSGGQRQRVAMGLVHAARCGALKNIDQSRSLQGQYLAGLIALRASGQIVKNANDIKSRRARMGFKAPFERKFCLGVLRRVGKTALIESKRKPC